MRMEENKYDKVNIVPQRSLGGPPRVMSYSETTDAQLWHLAKKYKIPIGGICFKDELNNLIPQAGYGYIINLADHTMHGTHWTCIYLDTPAKSKSAAYFDSFGQPMPTEALKFIKRYGAKNIWVNKKDIQSYDSGWCGIYCLMFIRACAQYPKLSLQNRIVKYLHKFKNLNFII